MLERSIPGYVQMRELTFAVGEKYLRKDGKISNIVDIGCSNGLSIYPFCRNTERVFGVSLLIIVML